MKPPFNFGLRFFLRVLLPGFLLAIATFPGAKTVLEVTRINLDNIYLLTGLVLLLGWWCSLMDMQIYMLFEGRRYWPNRPRLFRRIREYLVSKETARMKQLLKDAFSPNDITAREAATELRK